MGVEEGFRRGLMRRGWVFNAFHQKLVKTYHSQSWIYIYIYIYIYGYYLLACIYVCYNLTYCYSHIVNGSSCTTSFALVFGFSVTVVCVFPKLLP